MMLFPPSERILLNPLPSSDGGRGLFRTACSIPVYVTRPLGSVINWVVIPSNFVSDGASIPRWARPFLDPWGRVGLAALLHDYLLTIDSLSKWQADLQFFYALRSLGVPAFQATVMFFAVRFRRPPAEVAA